MYDFFFSPRQRLDVVGGFLSSFHILDLRPDNGGVKNSLPEGYGRPRPTHVYAHAYLCAGIPEPPRGERGAAYGAPSAVSDQLTALVSQANQRGENRSCFSTTSDQLVVLASSPEKGLFCARLAAYQPRGRRPSGSASRAGCRHRPRC